jgi:hypothetical protein
MRAAEDEHLGRFSGDFVSVAARIERRDASGKDLCSEGGQKRHGERP